MAEYIAQLEMSVFVMDYDHNAKDKGGTGCDPPKILPANQKSQSLAACYHALKT